MLTVEHLYLLYMLTKTWIQAPHIILPT